MVCRSDSIPFKNGYRKLAAKILTVSGLKTYYFTRGGTVRAVDDVSFDLDQGEILGLVGESGSGKTATALSIIGLIDPPGRIVDGRIILGSEDISKFSEREMEAVRGVKISMIFQDPKSFLSPYLSIGDQLSDAFVQHSRQRFRGKDLKPRSRETKQSVLEKCAELLSKLVIPDPVRILKSYPHQLSGGTNQRIMIAMALISNPDVIIADEPTTNLDVTVQAQILEILKTLVKDLKTSLLFITHDMGVVAEICDRVAVMYAGQIVESGAVYDVFRNPKHPYTAALMQASPKLGKSDSLQTIGGGPPNLLAPPSGCRFHPRCKFVFERCTIEMPELLQSQKQKVRCHLYS